MWTRWRGTALVCALFALAWGYLAAGIRVGPDGRDKPRFHIDEAPKIGDAYANSELLLEQRRADLAQLRGS